jgi:hypothetical protein
MTKGLGISYIWVDKYCIDQENAEQKQEQIPIMGQIYERAEVTIIAAVGRDANAGLSGIGMTARRPQPIFNTGGGLLVSTI